LAPKEGESSSSESDTTELHKRNSARQKKPLLRKGRARQRSPEEASIQQSSDEEQEKVNQRLSRSQTSSEESKTKATSTKKEVKKEAKTPNNKASNNTPLTKTSKKQFDASSQNKSKSEENPKQESQESSSSESHEEDEDEDEDDQEEEEEDEEPEEDDEGEQDKKKEKRVGRRPGTTLKKRIAHKLNTMTRSKHRKELELQLANSKVLRNDKIIRNSTTKIKRKYVRKVVDSKKEMMVTRLRNKRGLNSDLGPLNGRNAKLKGTKVGNSPGKPAKTSPQQQLYLEEYRYKLALKIPHRLISINKLNKVAASLPDLERRDLGQELACFKRNRPKTKAASKQDSTPKSIIDVLHLRVTNGSTASTQRKISVSAPASTNLQIHSETSQTSASTSLYEQPQHSRWRRCRIGHHAINHNHQRNLFVFGQWQWPKEAQQSGEGEEAAAAGAKNSRPLGAQGG